MFLSDNISITSALDYASGTAARNGGTLDLSGYDGVLAITTTATHAADAVGDFHWEGGDDDGLTDAADLLGTAIATDADSDDLIIVSDLYQPACRYVRGVITKNGANAQAESMLYIRYRSKLGPITNEDSGEVTVEKHGPGTAAGTK